MKNSRKKHISKSEFTYLEKMDGEQNRCTLCGRCREVCPTFLVSGKESFSCRGRINLISGLLNEGSGLKFTPEIAERLNSCINCKSCTEICPLDIDTGGLISSAKADLYGSIKLPFLKKFIFQQILPSPKRTDFFVFLLRFCTGLLGAAEGHKGVRLRLAMNLFKINPERILPQIASKNFFKQGARTKVKKPLRKRIALFIGCLGKYFFPDVADHAVSLLRKAGIQVVIPSGQVCCGTPAHNSGDLASAHRMAITNLSIFNKIRNVEAVVTLCGSCNNSLTNEYPGLLSAGEFKVPVYDIMEFISLEKIAVKAKFSESVVTYHHPSSLRLNGKLNKIVHGLLDRCYRQDFVSMKEHGKTCGSSCDFNIYNYDSIKSITAETVKNIQDSGADIIGVGSFGCAIRIAEQAKVEKKKIEIRHSVELIDI